MQGMWLDGKLALPPVWPYLYSLSKDPARSKVVGKVKIDIAAGQSGPGGDRYSWGFCAAAGSKNPDAAVEWVKWSTGTDMLADFGKTWINPVPRASAIDKVAGRSRHRRRTRRRSRLSPPRRRDRRRMNMVPQYSQLLDVLGDHHLRHHVEGDVAR